MLLQPSRPFAKERNAILALLLILATLGWAVVIWQAADGEPDTMMDAGMSLTMGMSAIVFLAIWIAMMVAMMFPTAAPMVLAFARMQASRREMGQTYIPVWLFVLAYLFLWTSFGILAFLLATIAQNLGERSMWIMENAARIGGAVLILAGVYQLSPLKTVCLAKCRSPMSFLMGSWRDGELGAVRMGLEHGAYCLGCCWLLFVILFPLGMMNVAAMAVITLLIFAEKSLAIGPVISKAAAMALVALGILVLIVPASLPTTL